MGYHVTILRTQKGKPDPITKSEVESLMGIYPGSQLHPDERNREVINVEIVRDGKDVVWLAFQNGELWTKNPGDNEIQAMIDIANHLGARVRGDDFGTFKTLTESYIHPDDQDEYEQAHADSRRAIARVKRNRMISWIIKLTAFAVLVIGYWVSRGR